MQLGACFAGLAIETSMLGAAHATANPLTARFDVTHGQAVGVMLPSVIRLNGSLHSDWYAELLSEVEIVTDPISAPDRLATLVREWLELASLATNLETLQIPTDIVATLASDAARQWTGTFNPIPLDESLIADLYHSSR